MNGEHWKQRPEGGSPFALRLLRAIARRGGRGLARLCLYPITAYFVAVRGPERRASRAYLARSLGRAPGLWDVARHIHTFAATILDRLFMLGGQMHYFDVRVSGLDALRAQHARGGALIFGSHLGSFEALRVLARSAPEVQVRVVFDRSHNPAMTQLLDSLDPRIAAGVIDAGQDGPSIVLAVKQALDEGALVALLVDRARPGEPWLRTPFLGAPAPFPLAPWLVAATLKAPVLLAFGLYRGGARYDLVFEPFSDGSAIARQDRPRALAAMIEGYAARLQHHACDAPYNWFNFYDFWHADDAVQDSTAHDGAADPGAHDDPAAALGLDAGAGLRRRLAVRRSA